ncbi:metalloregulator ArsR/SmtB family transcription factor [Parasphingopyxis sp.]|uniref:ArsR/SmtB family transcription factor n=1 Tax=Parasphingopyxis sp. TaxID=1920299 RepID=UPI00260784A1|nr:metalloregulator ArsR/SmtB family transcription factor [Parasphingopyxis sp.]
MSDLSATFAALGEPTRFAIVERLLREGELNAGALQSGTSISAPAISRHLKVLRKAGIVVQRIDKQQRIYAVRPEAVQAISAWTMSHKEFWQASFDRLAAILDQEANRK